MKLRVRPVNGVCDVIDRYSVRPLQVCGGEGEAGVAVHGGPFQPRHAAPVQPEDEAVTLQVFFKVYKIRWTSANV